MALDIIEAINEVIPLVQQEVLSHRVAAPGTGADAAGRARQLRAAAAGDHKPAAQ
ncbi:hypothetical protein MES5069_1160019 [Mesorhizobium escarrei]|uniref:Uncharacterized protein n=1 Tax=Mesorhizobium escarrei TaxID=666018 RepID=A0ABN8JG61_9HYPH|nr:hypothetical protein MES5069_1160019 [Mesorhizobium escarrei]